MAKVKPTDRSYQELKTNLDAIMAELQRDDLDVDKALEYYKQGLELTSQLEAYLKTAENKVRELKASFNAPE